VLAGIDGPILACGHSYGGAVLTNAVSQVQNVVGLVYICAQSPDEGETLADLEGTSRDSALGTALVQTDYPTGQGAAIAPELIVDRSKFAEIFAGDLPVTQGEVLAAVQRPTGAAAFSDKTHNPAWKILPSWAVVATGDKAAGADLILRLAERAGATITKLDGSHLVMISQPDKVAAVIQTALAAVT
jgi:pimeloyl-ACP methyl ester carboxylesterase